jgi:hypothetical protein
MAEVGTASRENAVPSIAFYSDTYTITSGMALTIAHGLPKVPKQVWMRLKCLTAELGYAIGDEVALSASAAVSVAVNSTSIKVVFATLPSIVNFSTQAVTAITAADWNLVVKAEVA